MDSKIIEEINRLRYKAAGQYGPIRSNCEGRGALDAEVDEVKAAMQERDQPKLRAELLDVINVAYRWVEAIDRGAGTA